MRSKRGVRYHDDVQWSGVGLHCRLESELKRKLCQIQVHVVVSRTGLSQRGECEMTNMEARPNASSESQVV